MPLDEMCLAHPLFLQHRILAGTRTCQVLVIQDHHLQPLPLLNRCAPSTASLPILLLLCEVHHQLGLASPLLPPSTLSRSPLSVPGAAG